MFEYKKNDESAIMKKQAEYVWRESVIELLPLRNGRENLGRKYMALISSYRNWVASLEEWFTIYCICFICNENP